MSVVTFPTQTMFDKMVAAIYQTLPWENRKDGATKVSKELGYKIDPNYLGVNLSMLRKIGREDPDRYGFTVPHTRRGSTGGKYTMVLVASNEEPYFDDTDRREVIAGAEGCVAHATSSLANEAQALKLAVPYFADAWLQKRVRSFARRIAQLAEEGNELLELAEEFDNENGAS